MRRTLLATVLSISLTAMSVQAQTVIYMVPKGETMEQAIKNAENDWAYCNRLRFDNGIPKLASKHFKYFMQECRNTRIANNDHSAPPVWNQSLRETVRLCSMLNEQFRSPYSKYWMMGSFNSCIQSELAN